MELIKTTKKNKTFLSQVMERFCSDLVFITKGNKHLNIQCVHCICSVLRKSPVNKKL